MHISAVEGMLGWNVLAFKVRVTVVEFVNCAPLFITIGRLAAEQAGMLQLSTKTSKPISTAACTAVMLHFLKRKTNTFHSHM
jgi:hypothetical protein